MKRATLEALKQHHVICHEPALERIRFGFGGSRPVVHLEQGAHLREGVYDVQHIGAFTYLGGPGSMFRHIDRIGRFCSIAGNIITGQVEHPLDMLSTHPLFYSNWGSVLPDFEPHMAFRDQCAAGYEEARLHSEAYFDERADRIVIGNDVWIGYGAFIRRGVKIGDGAVIAANAVVTKDVPPYTIVGGVPAKALKKRFDDKTIETLLQLRWWDYGLAAMTGVSFVDVPAGLARLKANIAQLERWQPAVIKVYPDERVEVSAPPVPGEQRVSTS